LYQRCAAIDTFYGVLAEMAGWLMSLRVTHVAMESTGIFTMPVYHALLEHGRFEQVLVCNAAHVKKVPGRKTDAVDAAWLAQLLECGPLQGSFLPPPQVKAVRDVAATARNSSGNAPRRSSGWVECSRTGASNWTPWSPSSPRSQAAR
jgi:hypothetical protein